MNDFQQPLAVVLSDREQAVYQAVRGRRDGVTASEAGPVAHAVPGPRGGKTHPSDRTCDYCEQEGKRVLGKLVRLGLLRRTRPNDGRGYVYILVDGHGYVGGSGYSQGDLPAGF